MQLETNPQSNHPISFHPIQLEVKPHSNYPINFQANHPISIGPYSSYQCNWKSILSSDTTCEGHARASQHLSLSPGLGRYQPPTSLPSGTDTEASLSPALKCQPNGDHGSQTTVIHKPIGLYPSFIISIRVCAAIIWKIKQLEISPANIITLRTPPSHRTFSYG